MTRIKQPSQLQEDSLDSVHQEVTLIIPTYNRPEFFSRLIAYYAAKNTKIYFLILDSSDEHIQKVNKKSVDVLGNQVLYLSFPSSVPVATKLLEGLKRVSTAFCAFCADDDLVFVEGLTKALVFLQNNSDYVCVDGIYLNFNPIGHDIHLIVEYAGKGINAEDPGARVFKLCQKYESLFYGVFRIENALKIFAGVVKNPTLHFQELFQATSALLIGKSYRLPVFYAARQHCEPAEQTRDKWQTYYWFADNPEDFLEHYLLYRNELWTFYQSCSFAKKCSKDAFFQIIDLAHAVYFGTGCPPEYFHSVLKSNGLDDDFEKSNVMQDNICSDLKKSWRIKCELFIEKSNDWISRKFSSLYSIRDMRTLNEKIQTRTKIKWVCKPSAELRWLMSVDGFRDAYYELCQYMSLS